MAQRTVPWITHDFGVTRDYIIFPVMPMSVEIERVRAGGDFYAYDQSLPCCYGIMPRNGRGSDVRWFKMAGAFSGHVMNAHSAGKKIHLNATISRGNGFPFFKEVRGN